MQGKKELSFLYEKGVEEIMGEYKLGKCVRIVRKDSIFKIKDWKINDIKDIQEIGGGETKTFFLKSKKVRQPIQVDKRWLDRNTKVVRCK